MRGLNLQNEWSSAPGSVAELGVPRWLPLDAAVVVVGSRTSGLGILFWGLRILGTARYLGALRCGI